MKIAFAWIGGLIALFALAWIVQGNAFFMYQFFAPKVAAVQSQVFHESQQYNDGMVRDLENLRMEYLHGNQAQQDALRATILHRFAGYDESSLTPELRSFYDSLR